MSFPPLPSDPLADPRCSVGVVFALGIEAGGLVDRLEAVFSTQGNGFVVRQGLLNVSSKDQGQGKEGRRIVLVESGAGSARARNATEALIAGHRPDLVISAGFAGGLDARVKRHDLVVADSVAHADGRGLQIDLMTPPREFGPGVHVGRVVSVDRIARLPAEKERLGREHDALAVDLESFSVAEVCRERRVRFLDVRAITDAVDEQLPPDVQRLTDQPSPAARLGAAVGAIWRRPSSLKDMWSLRENALIATDRLAGLLVEGMRG